MTPLKICFLSSEIMPYAKTGGLADVAGALIRELGDLGHEVCAFMPLYGSIRAKLNVKPVKGVGQVTLRVGDFDYDYSLQVARGPAGSKALVYFVDCPALFARAQFYTNDADEHRRFLLFTRAVLESCQRLGYAPDIFHCNDWHTSFLPLYLRTVYANEPWFTAARSVLTIHNIGYQGLIPATRVADIGLGAAESQLDQTDLKQGVINALKHGIRFADAVTTVSPTYAREICGALGMGMERELEARKDGVHGILNGVDYRDWDPRVDPYLISHFSPQDTHGKRLNKEQLIEQSGLNMSVARPLIGMVGRLAEQKGIEILFDALPAILASRNCGLVVLGAGESQYVSFFEGLSARFPGRVAFRTGYDEAWAHLIEAGSDMFLMPSRYEPCGLNQMYSLRYGTIPVVRKTGGLADSVQHFDVYTGTGTGCVFNDYDAPAVRWALNTVIDWYEDPSRWRVLMQNAMAQNFSWDRQVGQYVELYGRLRNSIRA